MELFKMNRWRLESALHVDLVTTSLEHKILRSVIYNDINAFMSYRSEYTPIVSHVTLNLLTPNYIRRVRVNHNINGDDTFNAAMTLTEYLSGDPHMPPMKVSRLTKSINKIIRDDDIMEVLLFIYSDAFIKKIHKRDITRIRGAYNINCKAYDCLYEYNFIVDTINRQRTVLRHEINKLQSFNKSAALSEPSTIFVNIDDGYMPLYDRFIVQCIKIRRILNTLVK